MPHGHADLGQPTPQSIFYDQGRFGRLFPTLPAFAADTKFVRDALLELGAKGGPMDAGDDLSEPITLITDPAKSVNNPDNPAITAGFTFLGQFLDHDMTFDPTSSLARQQDPESIRNFRIPALDLDNLYGSGPGASPHLYDSTIDGGRTTLLTEEIPGSAAMTVDNKPRSDLPRNSQKTALLGDPRNDENLIVSQLHLALIRFHNRVVVDLKSELGAGYTAAEIFSAAQRVVRWHYQWLVIHEFLVKT
ncbi:MAG: peroxidase, partial [Actinomycetota bacterium]|nr:peroxidase [Actinomycetota bacterium]